MWGYGRGTCLDAGDGNQWEGGSASEILVGTEIVVSSEVEYVMCLQGMRICRRRISVNKKNVMREHLTKKKVAAMKKISG